MRGQFFSEQLVNTVIKVSTPIDLKRIWCIWLSATDEWSLLCPCGCSSAVSKGGLSKAASKSIIPSTTWAGTSISHVSNWAPDTKRVLSKENNWFDWTPPGCVLGVMPYLDDPCGRCAAAMTPQRLQGADIYCTCGPRDREKSLGRAITRGGHWFEQHMTPHTVFRVLYKDLASSPRRAIVNSRT